MLLDESEQQAEGVTVAFDGTGAGTALGDQAAQEEVLHELREQGLRGAHHAPAGSSRVKVSNRPAMMVISSGTADRYQYRPRTSTWPM